MNNTVQIDDSQVRNLFSELAEDKISSILFSAIKKGAAVLKRNTVDSLRRKVNTSVRSTGKDIGDGVRMKGHKAYIEANVNIMGDYRLIFLEKGTKLRQNKNGANRGQITPRNFFAEARMNEQAVYDAIDMQLQNSLRKLQK